MKFFRFFITNFFARFLISIRLIVIVSFALITINSCDTTESVKPYQDQTFIKLYGGNGSEEGKDFVLLPDGGFVLTGSTTSNSFGGKDIYVVRTDKLGNVIWENNFGESGDDIGNAIILSSDMNSVYVCGELTDTSTVLLNRDVIVLHVSMDNGALLGNERRYGEEERDEFGTDIIELTSGGFFISSTMAHPDTSKYFLIETDQNLDTIPLRSRYIGTQRVNNYSSRSFENVGDSNNPFICFGSTIRTDNNSTTSWFHSFLYRSDGDATILPEFYGTDNNNEMCTDAFRTTDGGYILVGLVTDQVPRNEVVVRIGPNRQWVWDDAYANEFNKNVQKCSIIQTLDGGFMVSSTIELDDPLNDEISLLKLNSEGVEEWRKTYGSNEDDIGSKVIQLNDGSYVVVGTIGFGINPDSRSKMCLMKVNLNGELIHM